MTEKIIQVEFTQVPGSENSKFERLLIVKCVKMKLSPALTSPSKRHEAQQNASSTSSPIRRFPASNNDEQSRHASSEQPRNRVQHLPPVNPTQLCHEAIITKDVEAQETVIIASCAARSSAPAGGNNKSQSAMRRSLARSTVLETLSGDYGCDLAAEFPEVATRLDSYAEYGHHFGNVIFYPRNKRNDRPSAGREDDMVTPPSAVANTIMCIIMLDLEETRFKSLPSSVHNLTVVTVPGC